LIYANVTAIAIDVATAANVAANIATNFGNVNITIPSSNPDDGTFRFAPGSNLG